MGSAPFCPVILAGGRGTRFWPLSREGRPKFFLSPGGGASLLERAWARARALAPAADIFVALDGALEEPVRRALPDLAADNVLVEPEARDTGPAAVHAAWLLEDRRPGAVLALLPADHVIADEGRFRQALGAARTTATSKETLVCLGIPPAGPSSAYGYIECAGAIPPHGAAVAVARFVEKPGTARAAAMLGEGRWLWNAGIFVWRASTFLDAVERVSPELAPGLARLRRDGDAPAYFRDAPRVSVDRAVLEPCDAVWVVSADMGWDDLGDWESLMRHLPADDAGNVGDATILALDAQGCVVHSPDRPVVLLGARDLVIVHCDDVILVARREDTQRVREIRDLLRRHGREDLT